MVQTGKVPQTGTRTRWDTISFTVFVVVYVPCLATLAAIRKEGQTWYVALRSTYSNDCNDSGDNCMWNLNAIQLKDVYNVYTQPFWIFSPNI
jgi:hypothetical protein